MQLYGSSAIKKAGTNQTPGEFIPGKIFEKA